MNIAPADFFAGMAHATRLRCVMLLSHHDELCVCELTHVIGASQPHISRHLAHLRELGVIIDRREGLWIYYRINPALPRWIKTLLTDLASGIADQPPYAADTEALEKMPNRPGAPRCA